MTLHQLIPTDLSKPFTGSLSVQSGIAPEGSAEFFARDIRHAEGNDDWLKMVKSFASEKKILDKLDGEWLLSARQGEITATYTPFSYKTMTDRYARYLDETQMDDELYKWENIQIFQRGWQRLKAGEIDFTTFFKGLKFGNLVHYFSTDTWNTILKNDPGHFEYELNALYNEELPLNSRIKTFSEEVTRIFISTTSDVSKSTGQNERAIGVLLAFRYPDKYALFKDDYYKTLAKCLGQKPLPKWKKYSHYMTLVNAFKEQHLNQCEDIIAITNQLTKDDSCYSDPEHLLLIQNIFYRTLEAKAEVKLTDDADSYQKAIEKFSATDLERYLTLAAQTLIDFGISADDNRLSFSVTVEFNRIGVILGNRLINGIRSKQGQSHVLFIGDQLDNAIEQEAFTIAEKPIAWLNYFDSSVEWTNHWTSYHEHVRNEINRGVSNNYRNNNNRHFQAIIEKRMDELTSQTVLTSNNMEPLNQILFGPPGTGKTYLLSNEYFTKYTTTQSNISKEEHLTEVVSQLTWWQVVAIALKDLGPSRVQAILDHPWVQVKSRQSNSKNVRATLWGALQMHTPPDSTTVAYKQRQMPYLFDKGNDSSWMLLEDEYHTNTAELEQIRKEANDFKPKPDQIVWRYVFTTFHQSFTYEDFIEGLKPDLDDEAGDLKYVIEDGIFKRLCKRAEADPDNRYAIFIDEINRGNIAAIFGELITLIEHDKRKGYENELSVTLPYSKQRFSVPPNLDIYGTMNTADRSVEALDTALRRRFSFIEMPPRSELIASAGQAKENNGTISGIHLPRLLDLLNERIEQLLDKDHLIGHAYFMQVDSVNALKTVFRDKIIPLLQEYFFGDFGKIGLVLGNGFVRRKPSGHSSVFANFTDYDSGDLNDRMVYQLSSVDDMDEATFREALLVGGFIEAPSD